jgi:hypothetical protein
VAVKKCEKGRSREEERWLRNWACTGREGMLDMYGTRRDVGHARDAKGCWACTGREGMKGDEKKMKTKK